MSRSAVSTRSHSRCAPSRTRGSAARNWRWTARLACMRSSPIRRRPCGRAATPWPRPAATTRRPAIIVRLSDKNPDENCALASLGDVRLAQGELDAAITAYRRYQEATPKYGYLCAAQADFGWGRALDAAGQARRGAREIRRGRQARPRRRRALAGMGGRAREAGEEGRGRREARRSARRPRRGSRFP